MARSDDTQFAVTARRVSLGALVGEIALKSMSPFRSLARATELDFFKARRICAWLPDLEARIEQTCIENIIPGYSTALVKSEEIGWVWPMGW